MHVHVDQTGHDGFLAQVHNFVVLTSRGKTLVYGYDLVSLYDDCDLRLCLFVLAIDQCSTMDECALRKDCLSDKEQKNRQENSHWLRYFAVRFLSSSSSCFSITSRTCNIRSKMIP